MRDFDAIIIGSGIIGLAIARSLAQKTTKIAIIEKNQTFGMGISTRNSEVIHSGIHYPNNFLKSQLCISGRKLLYQYCKNKGVKFNKCGKYIISTSKYGEEKILKLYELAKEKNISSKIVNEKDISIAEPNVMACMGLFIEETGVVDAHALMNSLYQELLALGVTIVFKTKVTNLKRVDSEYQISFSNPDNTTDKVSTNIVVNSAGLHSGKISEMIGANDNSNDLHFWKGEYFWVSRLKEQHVNSLIYPLPESNNAGLGIHTTIDIDGRLKLGPNAVYLGQNLVEDYTVNEKSKMEFFDKVSKYLPNLKIDQLEPDYSGIRPKLQKPNESYRDFIIQNELDKGLNNYINLIGIESPGLTSALAIGNHVDSIIDWGF